MRASLLVLAVGCHGDPEGSRLQFVPDAITVEAGESVNLAVAWTGAPPDDPSLAWAADCGQVMGLTQRGSYVAPDAAASCEVTATSVAAPANVATLAVTVTPPVGGGAVRYTRHLASNLDDGVRRLAATADDGVVALVETDGDLGGPALGDLDVVVVRVGPDGDVVWTQKLATSTREFAGDVAVGADGTIWVVGTTYGALDGASAGASDAFLAALNGEGAVISIRQFGTDHTDTATAVAVGHDGAVVVGGWTEGALGGPSAGGPDAYVRRFDAGEGTWTRQIGGAGIDFAIGVAVDGPDAVLVGTTDGVVGAGSAGGMDWVVARVDADGAVVSIDQHGATTDDRAYGVAARPGGGVVVVGALGDDGFVTALDRAGAADWSAALATDGEDLGQAVAVAPDGRVYIAGATTGDLGTPNVGFFDAFVAAFEADGDPAWTRRIGTAADDYGWAIARTTAGDVVVGGRTDGLLADGAGWGSDGFLRRLGP